MPVAEETIRGNVTSANRDVWSASVEASVNFVGGTVERLACAMKRPVLQASIARRRAIRGGLPGTEQEHAQ